MKLDMSDIRDLEPVIRAAVVAVLDELRANDAMLGDRLGYPEAEAAALLGIARHVLRDARLRGEINARTVGRKILYSREALLKFLSAGPRR
jgi:hypothetical protein